MKLKTISDMLETAPFFDGMSEQHRQFIAGCASNVHVEQGRFLLFEGKPAERFYILRQGSVAIEVTAGGRGIVTIQTLEEGDIVGWSWMIPPYLYRFDARAVTPVTATAFDASCVRQKCESDPVFGYEIYKRVAQIITQRLTAAWVQLVDVYQ